MNVQTQDFGGHGRLGMRIEELGEDCYAIFQLRLEAFSLGLDLAFLQKDGLRLRIVLGLVNSLHVTPAVVGGFDEVAVGQVGQGIDLRGRGQRE